MIKKFEEFSETQTESKGSAGIAIILGSKILLVHPTNASWQKRTLGIPKGGINPGEAELAAAIRETYEETGIKISPSQLNTSPEKVDIYNKKQKLVGTLVYYVCRISDLSEIGLESERVPKQQLQLAEVDWAGFIEIEEAYEKITFSQLIVLDRARG
jgi:8-oxo-dGTP pyrophosphatase MutT (NUDIX family)